MSQRPLTNPKYFPRAVIFPLLISTCLLRKLHSIFSTPLLPPISGTVTQHFLLNIQLSKASAAHFLFPGSCLAKRRTNGLSRFPHQQPFVCNGCELTQPQPGKDSPPVCGPTPLNIPHWTYPFEFSVQWRHSILPALLHSLLLVNLFNDQFKHQNNLLLSKGNGIFIFSFNLCFLHHILMSSQSNAKWFFAHLHSKNGLEVNIKRGCFCRAGLR